MVLYKPLTPSFSRSHAHWRGLEWFTKCKILHNRSSSYLGSEAHQTKRFLFRTVDFTCMAKKPRLVRWCSVTNSSERFHLLKFNNQASGIDLILFFSGLEGRFLALESDGRMWAEQRGSLRNIFYFLRVIDNKACVWILDVVLHVLLMLSQWNMRAIK